MARSDEIKAARRRRTDNLGTPLKLATSAPLDPAYEHRWINDAGVRMYQKTRQDDWDIVTQEGGVVKEDATDLGSAVSVVVGTKPDGSPLRSYLCRKPKAFAEEDRAAKEAERRAIEEQIRTRAAAGSEGASGPNYYTPGTGRNVVG
jgi:hypothetical protein